MKINTRRTLAALVSGPGWFRYIAGAAVAMVFAVPVLYSQEQPAPATAQEVQELRQLVHDLQAKVAALESQAPKQPPAAGAAENLPGTTQAATGAPVAAAVLSSDDRGVLDFFRGTTINLGVDGYYGYNFNQPVGRVNLLRAYDVSSNSFSLNQANLIIEHAARRAAD